MKRKRLKSNKKRNKAQFKPRVFVLGDGETEESYIERLKEIKYFKDVNLKFEKGNIDSFTTKLKEHLAIHENILLILDIDNERKNSKRYGKIKQILDKYTDQVFYNNYSFETWLLNHKEEYGKPIINKKDYNKDFKDIFGIQSWSKYKNKENRDKVMNQISKDKVDFAKDTIKKSLAKNQWYNNPSSNMDKFIDKIFKIEIESPNNN